MPYKEHEIEKLYWKIGEAAEELGVSESHVRFYDAEFRLHIHRGPRNSRRLNRDDIEFIRRLIRLSKFFHLQGLKDLVKQNKIDLIENILK